MNRKYLILLDAGAGGAGGGGGGGGAAAPAFDVQILPEDLRGEASLATIKTIPDLARSFVNAQKLVGADKVVIPGANATPEQMAEFYSKLGRPGEAAKYAHDPAIKIPDGLNLKPEAIDAVKKQFHDLGLSKKQGDALLSFYLGSVSKDFTEANAAQVQAQAAATSSLKNEWGDKYNANLDIAKGVLRKFADPQALQELESSGLGNNPQLIKMLHKVGLGMLEDSAGGEGPLPVGNAAQAMAEIGRLKTDTDFMKVLFNRGPGHDEAVKRWEDLHRAAYPGKSS